MGNSAVSRVTQPARSRRRSRLVTGLLLLLSLVASSRPSAGAQFHREATAKLLAAAAAGEGDEMVTALAAGADPNATEEQGNTPLMLAATEGVFGDAKPALNALLAAKASLEAKNKDGATALMLAARENEWNVAEWLLVAGAEANATDPDGWTALVYASYNGSALVAKALLSAQADPQRKTKDGWDAVLLAIANGHGGIAETLLTAGASVPKIAPSGNTPLHLAVMSGDLASTRLVLATKPDLAAPDTEGWTALGIAANNGLPQVVMELLRAGADRDAKDKEGKTALERAIDNEEAEVIALLGGPWDKPVPAGGTTVSVPCPVLGGPVLAHIAIAGADLVFTTTYPSPLSWYLGGGFTNRAASATQFIYDGSIAPTFYLDTDVNAKTGQRPGPLEKAAAGAEFALDYMEYGTSVTLRYETDEGEQTRQVYNNVLSPTLEQNGESFDTGEFYPVAVNDRGVLVTKIPLALLGLSSGQKIRMAVVIGDCPMREETLELR
jgi:ankyrin repeat protein